MTDNQITEELITKACYAQIQAYGLPYYSSLFYELAVQLYKLQKKVDKLENPPKIILGDPTETKLPVWYIESLIESAEDNWQTTQNRDGKGDENHDEYLKGFVNASMLYYTAFEELEKKLISRRDGLIKDTRNSALEEAMCIVNENRMNSNGATMTVDSLRALLK